MSLYLAGSYKTSPRRITPASVKAAAASAGRAARDSVATLAQGRRHRVTFSPLARELAELGRIQIARPGRPPLSDGSNEPGRALTFGRVAAPAAPVGCTLGGAARPMPNLRPVRGSHEPLLPGDPA